MENNPLQTVYEHVCKASSVFDLKKGDMFRTRYALIFKSSRYYTQFYTQYEKETRVIPAGSVIMFLDEEEKVIKGEIAYHKNMVSKWIIQDTVMFYMFTYDEAESFLERA